MQEVYESGLPETLDQWLETKVLIGERLTLALRHDRSSPFALMMKRAADHAVIAAKALLEVDLKNNVADAVSHQSEVRRYLQLYGWINEALNEAESASRQMAMSQPDSEEEENFTEKITNDQRASYPDS